MLTAEEFANLTQQNPGKCTVDAVTLSASKLINPISNGQTSTTQNGFSKPFVNSTCASPPGGMYDGDVSIVFLRSFSCSEGQTLIFQMSIRR